jgi:sugar phosphate isomerase/epimerase
MTGTLRYPLGVVAAAWGIYADQAVASQEAAKLGFDHIDVTPDIDPATLALPVGYLVTYPDPIPGCISPPPFVGDKTWDETVAAYRAVPGALMEPLARGVVNSLETVQAMADAVPGLQFCIDTGHVADWGGDPLDLLPYASNVQLRQGKPGQTQVHIDDPSGVVDFAAVLRRLDELEYAGILSVEYYDVPDWGWPLENPVRWVTDLAAHVRSLSRLLAGGDHPCG